MLRMQCIHRDIHKYRTKVVRIGIGAETFTCRLGVVPHLDSGVLIGQDCPILAQLLRKAHHPPGLPANPSRQAEPMGVELHVRREYLARLT